MKESNQQVPPFKQASFPHGVPSQSPIFRPCEIVASFKGICTELTEKCRTQPLYGTGSFDIDKRGNDEISGRPPKSYRLKFYPIGCLYIYLPKKMFSLEIFIPLSVFKIPEFITLSTERYAFLP